MSEIEFNLCGSGNVPNPFKTTISDSYYVLHVQNTEIKDDGKTHVYLMEVKGFSRKISNYELNDETLLSYPKKIYVIYGNDLEMNKDLDDFLEENSYVTEEYEHKEEIGCESYRKFVKTVRYLGATMDNYLKIMFGAIGVEDEAIDYVKEYIDNFFVAVTASDVKRSSLENYELLESYGDHASWKPMTEIFLKYMKDNGLEMKESIITSMHRSFVSKIVQSKICREIQLSSFINKKGGITVSTREDVFEAFTGALFYTDMQIKAYIGKYYHLGEKFLKWCFSSVDLSVFEEKPEITQFHEYMKILIGPYNFEEKKVKGQVFMSFERAVFDKLKAVLPHVSDENLELFLIMVKEPYRSDTNMIEVRRLKYLKINRFILDNFGDEKFFNTMKNRLSMKDWDEISKERFFKLVDKEVTVDKRYYDKSKVNFYWVVQSLDKKDVVSTMNYSNSEDPATLISLMEDQKTSETNSEKVRKIPYVSGNFYLEGGQKYSLVGEKKDIEEFLKENLLTGENKYFLLVNNNQELPIEYSPYHGLKFTEKFNIEYVRSKFQNRDSTEYPRAIYRYIGDRMSYGQISLIAMKKFGITDDHNMSAVKNFFRSKNLKDELTRLINIRDSKGELVHYDELLGMNYHSAPLVIEYIHSRMIFPSDVTKNPVDVLNRIVKYVRKEKNLPPGKIELVNNEYVYIDTKNKKYSVALEGHNYNQVKYYFSKFLIDVEKTNNKNWNELVNNYFSSFSKYQDLECLLIRKKIFEWEIVHDKNEKNLIVSFNYKSKPYVFKTADEQNFSSVVKQISDSLGM